MDYDNFVLFMGHIFVGNWFVALQCKMIHYFVICFGTKICGLK